jgi:hypothetical protein
MKRLVSYLTLIVIVSFLILIWGCEKDISVDLPRADEKIVVEAFIEPDSFAVVFITKNASYFDPVDTIVVANSIIKGNQALVIVDDGNNIDTLIPAIFPRWPYHGYKGTKIKGQENGIYNLKVFWNNHEYFATTSIPKIIPIDSIKFDKFSFNDSLGFFNIFWKDPIEIGNYYSVTVRNHKRHQWFYRPFFGIHILDDKIDNNSTMFYGPISQGYERNAYYNDFMDNLENIEFIDILAYRIGDTISIKLSTMDKMSFQFWSSWYRNLITAGNPFANPASVKSNIQGDPANGYWIGYGSYISKIHIVSKDSIEVLP